MSSIEREVKLHVDPAFVLPDLVAGSAVPAVEARPDLVLVATYLDTPDCRLLRRGITLRHRRDLSGATEHGWTLKLPAGTRRVRLDRTELTWPGDASVPPPAACSIVQGLVRRAPLVVVAVLRSHRRRLALRGAGGELAGEVDDDLVTVLRSRRPPARTPVSTTGWLRFREVEVEVAEDHERVLGEVVARLRAAGAVPASPPVPKLARALGLDAGPRVEPAPGPRASLGQVIEAAVASGVGRLLEQDLMIRASGHVDGNARDEAVHQARVACRRLRSDLLTYRPALDRQWVRAVRTELEWAGDALGAVRDADVLVDLLDDLLAAEPREGPFAAVMAEAARRRDEALLVLDDLLGSERYLDLLDRMEAATAALPFAGAPPAVAPESPAAEALPRLLEAPWRRLRKTVQAAGEAPDDDALHQVRIRAKQLRYAAEAASSVLGDDARNLAVAAAGLQSVLGDLHDAVVAEEWLRTAALAGPPSRAYAAGQLAVLARQRQGVARASWRRAWRLVAKRAKAARRWLAAKE